MLNTQLDILDHYKLWSKLPKDVKDAENLNTFKYKIRTSSNQYLGSAGGCLL